MTVKRYFAEDNPDAFERERLAVLTQLADPVTVRRLTGLGIGPGWRCLEVAAGNGSVARWMSEQVGLAGRVVATDLNLRFLKEQDAPNLHIRQHNILADDLESAHYDVVHCRCLLQHLPDPSRGLARLAGAVRPGGWLLVEDTDFRSFGAANPEHPRTAEFHRISRAMRDAMTATQPMDHDFGRRLTFLVDRLGLRDLGHEGATRTDRGGGPMARFLQMTDEVLRDRLIASGAITDADFDERSRALDDPTFWFVGWTLFGVWGKKAEAT
jgi:SAM-dependent methyltransferase